MNVKFKNGFSMIDRHLLNRRPVRRLVKGSKKGEGAGNLAIYLTSVMVMLDDTDGYGDEYTIMEIAKLCCKSVKAVMKVIENTELYQHNDDGTFQIRMLCDVTVTEKQSTVDPKLNSSSTMVQPELNSDTPIYAGAKTKTNIKTKERNTAKAVKETAATAVDFHSVIYTIFDDTKWLRLIEASMKIQVASDDDVKRFVMESFINAIEINCVYKNGEPYNEQTMKRYFANWIRPGGKSRKTLDAKLDEFICSLRRDNPRVSDCKVEMKEKERTYHNPHCEYIDRRGRRRGPHNEPVDKYAEPCPSANMIYNNSIHKWEYYGC